MINFGAVPAGSVLPVIFDAFDGGTGASITLSGLAVTDIEIYKGTSITQRASDAGYVLIDTDGIDIDGITGIHGFSIDTGDNTDPGFYAVGSFFTVVVSSVTIDAQTVNFVAATFRLTAAEAIAGKPKVDVDAWLGTAAATPTVAGVPEVDVTHWLGTAASTPTVAGVPNVNVKTWNDLTTVALPLVPTTAGRTLDVSAGGEAGLDWANIGSPTTAQNLSATNIDVDQVVASVSGAVASVTGAVGSVTGLTAATVHADLDDIQARLPAALTVDGNIKADTLRVGGTLQTAGDIIGDTNDLQTRLPAALVSGRIDASVGAMAADVMTAAAAAADLTTELQNGLATAAALDTVDNLVDTEVAAILAAVDTEVSAILALLDDARAEPAQGAPPVNPDAMTKLDYLYKAWRNKKTNDGTVTNLYADDGVTIDHKQGTAEAGGTVTKDEWITGL